MTIVYRFRSWDISTDEYRTSIRWATRERIEAIHGEIISEGVEVPDEFVGQEIAGMTNRHFDALHPPRKDFGR